MASQTTLILLDKCSGQIVSLVVLFEAITSACRTTVGLVIISTR